MDALDNLLGDGQMPNDVAYIPTPDPECDLFEIADWVAEQLGLPVTIEDPRSRVIAFSSHVGPVDIARTESILRRAVPRQYLDHMREYGVFRRLATTTSPIFLTDVAPRVAMPVRSGKEFLGSIWVATREPLSPEHSRLLIHSAAIVAVYLLRRRQLMGLERRVHTDSVRHLLAGRSDEVTELSWLTEPGGDLLVMATSLAEVAADQNDAEWERHVVTDGVRSHLLAVASDSVTGLVDDAAYSVIRLSQARPNAQDALVQSLADFITGFTRNGHHHSVHIGLGSRVSRPRDLQESRETADLVVETLAESGRVNQVATIEAVDAHALLVHSRKVFRRSPALGGRAVSQLRAYDEENGTLLAPTLYAWLCAHGRFEAAAAQLHVHPNTVRYRLRQLRDLRLMDLDNPVERFAAYLHLSTTPR